MAKPVYKKRKEFKIRLLKNLTFYEKKFCIFLGENKVKHRSQYIIPPYIVDFYIPKKGLVIELDGRYHNRNFNQVKDSNRDMYMFSLGIIPLRYNNNADFERIFGDINEFSDLTPERLKKIQGRINWINHLFMNKGYNGKFFKSSNPSNYIKLKEQFNHQMRKTYKGKTQQANALR